MSPNGPVLSLIQIEKRYAPRRGYHLETSADDDDDDAEAEGADEAPRRPGGWALAPLSADFYPGERVALVGGHGAGKTTLLRLIAGTLLANGGTVRSARTCLLNDYITPFNAEARVRDNLALIARLQGIAPARLLERIAELEALAGLSVRLDAPARAVAKADYTKIAVSAALLTDPAIILADNSLAPGDLDFRERIEDRITAMTDEGAVLLFAPKKTSQAQPLCRRGLWLDNGRLQVDGPASDAVNAYLESTFEEEDDEEEEIEEVAPAPRGRHTAEIIIDEKPHIGPHLARSEDARFGNVSRFEAVDESGAAQDFFETTDVRLQIDIDVWMASQSVDLMIELMVAGTSIAMMMPPEPYKFPQPGKLSLCFRPPAALMTSNEFTARLKATFLNAALEPVEMVVKPAWFSVHVGGPDDRLRRFERSWPPKRKAVVAHEGEWTQAQAGARAPSS